MLKILIADAHPLLRRGVRDLIEGHEGWTVCGEATDGREALELAAATKPDLLIVDVSLPLMDGIEVARRLRQKNPDIRVLVLTTFQDHQTVRRALAAGVRGYILKTDRESQLEEAITLVSANLPSFSSQISEILLLAATGHSRDIMENFTQPELQMAQLIADGKSSEEIARELGVDHKTFENYKASAFRKAKVRSTPEFVRFAIRHGLIAP
jgi:DNA-binding NarL/FixJ family response regulator